MTLLDTAKKLSSKLGNYVDQDKNTPGVQLPVIGTLKAPSLTDFGRSAKTYTRNAVNNIARDTGRLIRGPVSPVAPQGIQRVIAPIRNIAGTTAETVIRDIPSIAASAARLSPAGQLYTQAKGAKNPQMQQEITNQRFGDVYNAAKGYGYATGGVANVAGGVVGMGMGAVGNVLNGKKITDNYAENFAGGVQSGAAFGPISKTVGGALKLVKPQGVGNVRTAINMIQTLDKPIMKFGNTMGHSAAKEIVLRAVARGGKEALEGIATGMVRPLAQGETRGQAVASDVIQSMLMGVVLQSGGDFSEAKIKPLLKQTGMSIKHFNYWLQDQGLVGDNKGGYIKFGEDIMGSMKQNDPLVQEARKYKTTVDINNENDMSYLKRIFSEDQIKDMKNGKMTNWRGTSYEDIGRINIVSGKPTGLIINDLNPTGGLYVDYTPQQRIKAPLGENMTTLDKTMNKSPEEMITIYRGVSKPGRDINPGDFITTSPEGAKGYGEYVITKKVKLSDILDDKREPLGGEYLYRPQNKSQQGGYIKFGEDVGITQGKEGPIPNQSEIKQSNLPTSSNLLNVPNDRIAQTIQSPQLPQKIQGSQDPLLQSSNLSQKSQPTSSDNILQQAKQEIQKQPDKKQTIKAAWNQFYTDYVNRMQPVEDLTKSVEKSMNVSIRPEYSPKYQIMKLLGAGGTAELRHRKELDPIIKELGNIDKSDFDVFLKANRDVELGQRGIFGSNTELAQQRIQALGQKYDLNKFKEVATKLYDYQDKGLQKLVEAGFIDDVTYKTIKGQNEAYVPFQRVMDEVDNYLGLPTKKLSQGKQPISKIVGSERAIQSPLESIIANTYKLEGAVSKNNVSKSIANLQKIDPNIGITPLRTAENVKKRIDIYTELKELGGNKNKLDRLFSTRNRWSRKIKSELNRLNSEGIEVYLKRKPSLEFPDKKSGIQLKQSFTKPDITTDTGDTFRGPAAVTGYSIKDVYVQPSSKEVKDLVNDLVNSPPEVIKAIKSKIATRENKLGGILDELESLRTNIDTIKSKRSELFDEAKLIQDAKTKGKDVISVWNNGIKELYEVPEDINKVVKGLNEEQVGQVVKLLSIPANLLRQGATGRNIDFMVPNIVKDQFDAAVSSKYGYRPFIDYFNGLGEMIKSRMGKPNLYEEYAKSGGKIFYEMAGGRKSIARELEDATKQKSLGKKFFNTITDGLDFLGKLSETPTRVGLFKRALQGSGNKLIAANEAREGTLDFARMGAKMKVANSIIPFLNVGVQGFDKLIRSAKDNPAKMILYGTMYGIAPQIALTRWNNEMFPEEYKEIGDDIKQDNFVFVTGRSPEGKVQYVSASKGNILPYITNPVDNMLSAASGFDNQSFSTLMTQLVGDALPLIEPGRDLAQTASRSLGSVIPQAIKPAIENVANFNFYKGKPIVPWYMENKVPTDQAYDSTELPYKYLGNLIQVSPLKVKNILEGYLSGFVKTPLQLASIMQKVSRGEAPSRNEIPVLRRFVAETYDNQEQFQEKQQKEQDKILDKEQQRSQVAPLEKRLFGEVSAAEKDQSKDKLGQVITKQRNLSNATKDMKDYLAGELKTKDIDKHLSDRYGVTQKQAYYNVIKSLPSNEQATYVHQIMVDKSSGVKELDGLISDKLLTSPVAKEMYNAELIDEKQYKSLVKYINSKTKRQTTKKAKKPKVFKAPAFRAPTLKSSYRPQSYKKLTLRDLASVKPRKGVL